MDASLFEEAGAELDAKGRPVVDEQMQTSVPGLYAAGDARRGPATVVEAIADAAKAAAAIAGISYETFAPLNASGPEEDYLARKGSVSRDLSASPDCRCLGCSTVCGVCADVCPNRANVVIRVPDKCQAQILHVDGMCNECGNCAVFCPYKGRPYRDKLTLFWSEEDFDNSENEGFLSLKDGLVRLRFDGAVREAALDELEGISADAAALIRTVIKDYAYLIP